MQALERLKQHTDDKDILNDIELMINKIKDLPERIEEKRLIKKRARDNFKKGRR